MKTLGIVDEMTPKTRRIAGVTLMQLLTRGEIDVAVTFASEVNDPGVIVVGPLPREISTPTALVGFISAHSKVPDAARSVLRYLASADAAQAYRACAMQPGPQN